MENAPRLTTTFLAAHLATAPALLPTDEGRDQFTRRDTLRLRQRSSPDGCLSARVGPRAFENLTPGVAGSRVRAV